jgi:hypothetical protein
MTNLHNIDPDNGEARKAERREVALYQKPNEGTTEHLRGPQAAF